MNPKTYTLNPEPLKPEPSLVIELSSGSEGSFVSTGSAEVEIIELSSDADSS